MRVINILYIIIIIICHWVPNQNIIKHRVCNLFHELVHGDIYNPILYIQPFNLCNNSINLNIIIFLPPATSLTLPLALLYQHRKKRTLYNPFYITLPTKSNIYFLLLQLILINNNSCNTWMYLFIIQPLYKQAYKTNIVKERKYNIQQNRHPPNGLECKKVTIKDRYLSRILVHNVNIKNPNIL